MLTWEMTVDISEKTLYVKTVGILDITSATIMRNEGATLIKKHGLLFGMLDHRGLNGDALSTLDIYNLPKRYMELGISHKFKMALVVPKEFLHNLKFYETVCRNNGYSVSIFFDYEKAMMWLKGLSG